MGIFLFWGKYGIFIFPDILKNLPVKYRDVFLLKYSNHMSNAEISKILNISEGTIRQRIARGKLIIKEEIERLEGK